MPITEASAAGPRSFHFGEFVLDLRGRVLRKANLRIRLRPQAFKTLAELVLRAGEVVTREELRQQVWDPDTFVDFNQGLNDCVKEIRAALGDDAARPLFIETVTGLGYRFVASVQLDGPSTPDLATRAAGLPRRASSALLASVLAFVAAGLVARSSQLEQGGASRGHERIIVAVLPFESLDGDEGDQQYFLDGMTEEVIAQLGRAHPARLGVIARASAMHYRARTADPAAVGRRLRADYVMVGSVRRSADSVRIAVALLEPRDGTQVWSASYDRHLGDLLALQAEVARAVVREVHLTLDPAGTQSAERSMNAEAYQLYLKGRFFWNRRNEVGLTQALDLFQRAIDKDPGHPLPFAALADTWIVLADFGARSPHDSFPAARLAALEALSRDPRAAEAHASLGAVLDLYDRDPEASEKEFRKALELNPSYPSARQWYSMLLRAQGRILEALDQARQAVEIDPLSLAVNQTLAMTLLNASDYSGALEVCRRNVEAHPDAPTPHYGLGRVLLALGRPAEAVSSFRRAVTLAPDPPVFRAALAHALARDGRRSESLTIARELEGLSRRRYVAPYQLALIYAGLAKPDEAFAWLNQAREQRDPCLRFVAADERFKPLRPDARFAALTRELGLLFVASADASQGSGSRSGSTHEDRASSLPIVSRR